MAKEKIQGTLWIKCGSGSTREHIANRREALPLLLTAMLTSIVSTLIFIAALPSILGSTPIISQDLPCKFSLAAWNVTWHNANSTGSPLLLGQLADGTTNEVTSTYASYPYNVYPTLSLTNGSLRTYRASGVWLTHATAVTSGGLLSWADLGPTRLPALAAYGFDDLWSQCPETGVPVQTSVFFNISDVGIKVEQSRKCWRVRLHLVPVGSSKYLQSFLTRTNNKFSPEC
ncbi:hypothetical protein B0H13DRAFT_1856114 [Mycena leptocephala]|nr:hypothetical protein B0H13DRAFT_1856114 [Mycena leptocephala]